MFDAGIKRDAKEGCGVDFGVSECEALFVVTAFARGRNVVSVAVKRRLKRVKFGADSDPCFGLSLREYVAQVDVGHEGKHEVFLWRVESVVPVVAQGDEVLGCGNHARACRGTVQVLVEHGLAVAPVVLVFGGYGWAGIDAVCVTVPVGIGEVFEGIRRATTTGAGIGFVGILGAGVFAIDDGVPVGVDVRDATPAEAGQRLVGIVGAKIETGQEAPGNARFRVWGVFHTASANSGQCFVGIIGAQVDLVVET